MPTYEGGCECGSVRYRMGEPIFVDCCHCRQCQKITGSAFAINAMIEQDRLEITRGAAKLLTRGEKACCTDCGTLLWGEHRMFGGNIKFLRVGTLDEGERIVPDAHFFSSGASIRGLLSLPMSRSSKPFPRMPIVHS